MDNYCNLFLKNSAKQPNGIAPNNQTELRQTTKRNCAKQPNEIAPNNQTKVRQTTKRNCAKQPN